MSTAAEYIRSTKRLAIIQKWICGQEDPEYEVLPTRKEGKYIVKKKEQNDKPDEDKEKKKLDEDKEKKKLDEDKNDKLDEDKNMNNKDDKLDEGKNDNIDEGKEKKKLDDNKNERKDDDKEKNEEDMIEYYDEDMIEDYDEVTVKEEIEEMNNKLKAINKQILIQLQEITDFIQQERKRKEQKNWIIDIIQETLRLQNINEDIAYKYNRDDKPQQMKLKRKSRVFADMES